MAEPVTLGGLLMGIAVGVARTSALKGGAAGYRRIAEWWKRGALAERDAALGATHEAYIAAMDAMVKAAEGVATGAEEEAAALALKEMVDSRAFREFRKGEQFDLAAVEGAIERAFVQGEDAAATTRAFNEAVVSDLAQWGVALPDSLAALFVEGMGAHASWDMVFESAFREQVTKNEGAFRLLTLDALGEVQGVGRETNAMVAELYADMMSRRGSEISQAEVADAAILRIARKIAADVEDRDQALLEIDRAVELLLRERPQPGDNLDASTAEVLGRIDRRARAGEFDEAADEAARAFDDWQAGEAERRDQQQQIGRQFAMENVRANQLRRDAEATARWIAQIVDMEHADDGSRHIAIVEIANDMSDHSLESGGNFELEIAISLTRLTIAKFPSQHILAHLKCALGISLRTKGMRLAKFELIYQAISEFTESLKIYQRENSLKSWVYTKGHLATSLTFLGEGRRDSKALVDAIRHFEEAIRVCAPEDLKMKRAELHIDMGTALSILGDAGAGVSYARRAVAAYREGLKVITKEVDPVQWASTQGNLGNALETIGKSEPESGALEEAETAFMAALEVITRDRPLRWAAIQAGLGVVCRRLADKTGKSGYIDRAIIAFRNSIEVQSRDDHSISWAKMSENLAGALLLKRSGPDRRQELSEAICLLNDSIETYSEAGLLQLRSSAQDLLRRVEAEFGALAT